MKLDDRVMCMAALLGAACGGSGEGGREVAGPPTAASWREAYDLDGDGKNDRIIDEFTGGAHCCYRIGAVLSSTGEAVMAPFELDGGYPQGLDLSRPEQLAVRARPGGLPEIVYQIAVYNGEPQPLEPAWTEQWHVRSHRVALCFAGGKLQARDEAPARSPCKR